MGSWKKDPFFINTNKKFLDVKLIHHFLSHDSYWAKGISFDNVQKSINHTSICFGMYENNPEKGEAKQVGFARIVTDFVRFAYIMDVFVLPEYRGIGLSKWLLEIITKESELKNISSIMLATADAHGLYSQFGFRKIENPEKYMKWQK